MRRGQGGFSGVRASADCDVPPISGVHAHDDSSLKRELLHNGRNARG